CPLSPSPFHGLQGGSRRVAGCLPARRRRTPPWRAIEAPPYAADQALVRQVARFVAHRRAADHVEAEIEMAQAPAAAERDLLEDRIGARAQRRVLRGIEAVHRGQR